MWVRSRDKGGQEWDVVALEIGRADTAEGLLQAAMRQIAGTRAA